MFAGGLILALTLIGVAIWLHWNELQGWPAENESQQERVSRDQEFDGETDRAYLQSRSRIRFCVNLIIGICGALIFVATIVGPGRVIVWASTWTTVAFALMIVVILAVFDALRTHSYHSKKLQKIRQNLESEAIDDKPT